MKINATEQTSTFPYPKKQLAKELKKNLGFKWETALGSFEISKETIEWIKANSYVSMYDKERSYIYNKAYYEAFLADSTYEKISLFELIREWANERDLIKKGDSKTQLIKLYEETGELSKAVLDGDKEGIIDAIGDSVVVLTNLAEFADTTIETCIGSAYDEISSRTGRMINGTFVKDK